MIDLVQWRAMIGQWHIRQISGSSFKSCSSVSSLSMRDIIGIPLALLFGLRAICLQILLDSKQGLDRAISSLETAAWNVLWQCSASLIKALQRKKTTLALLLAFCMVVQPILLIRAGDVERNPGPPKKTTPVQPPELRVVLRELGPKFVDWYPLGVFLSIDERDLDAIRQQKFDMQFIDMIKAWLRKTDATWMELNTALKEIGECKLADQISRKYCQEEQSGNEDDTTAGINEGELRGGTTSTAIQQVKHIAPLPGAIDSGLKGLSEEQEFDISADFSFMFAKVVELLDKTIDPNTLSNFLSCLCQPVTGHPYIDREIYRLCKSTEDILKSLVPQFINSMNLKLLQTITEKFSCEEARRLVEQYNSNFPRFASLKRLGDPLSEEEIEACIGVKRVKVLCKGDADHTTKSDIESIQEIIEKNTGIDSAVIIYVKHSPGSIVLVFLIPEVADDLFKDLPEDSHGWTDFEDSIILTIKVDDFTIHLQDPPRDLVDTSSKHTELLTPTPNAVKRVPIFETSEAKEWKENFTKFVSQVANELEKAIEITELKEYLLHFGHILYPESKFIDPQLLADAQTAEQVLTALTPRFINFLNIQLLLQIADRFGLTTLKKHTILEYYNSIVPVSRLLSSLPDPISEEEIVELQGVDRLRVTSNDGLSNVMLHNVHQLQNALEKSTGIKYIFFTLASWEATANIHQFTFLVPKSISSIFWELSDEDLAVLSECGAITIELNYTVIAYNIQDYQSEKQQQLPVPPRRQRPRARVKSNWSEYALPEDVRELVDMPHMHEVCSDSFLKDFSKYMTSWHDLAPQFGISEDQAEMIDGYHEDIQALHCWKRKDPSTATYKNLIECFYYHGHTQEYEILLEKLVLQIFRVIHARKMTQKMLQKMHIQKMSRYKQLWPGVPDLMQFNRSFAQTEDKELKEIDYFNHYEMLEHYPFHTKIISLKSFLNMVASRQANFFVIKGPPASGKTLLMERICAYWACNYALHHFDLVFHIDMKKYNRFDPMTVPPRQLNLKELIESQFHGSIVEDVYHSILATEGERVIFILDGCHPNVFKRDCIQSWLQSTLKKASIIVTAITTAIPTTTTSHSKFLAFIRQEENNADYIQLDLLGLSELQISKQALKSGMDSNFLPYLAENPNIKALTSYPVYLAAVIQVYVDTPHNKLPSTWTKLFAHLTLQLLRHAFPSSDIPSSRFSDHPHFPDKLTPQSVSMLPPEPHLFFTLMCTMACVGLQHGRSAYYAFSSLRVPMSILPEFFTASPHYYHFTMPLLQYFLAAFSIHPEHINHSSSTLGDDVMVGYLWIFHAGLYPHRTLDTGVYLYRKSNRIASHDPNTLDYLYRKSNRIASHDPNISSWCKGDAIRSANCLFEAERAVHLPYYESELDSSPIKITIRNKILTRCDIYHLLHCVHGRTHLFDSNLVFYDESVLNLQFCHLGTETIREIAKCFARQFFFQDYSTIQHLFMEDCQITDQLLEILAMGLKNGRLKTLNFSGNEISNKGAIVLAEVLKVNPALVMLNLAENNISDSGVGAIARELAMHQSLLILDLHSNSISDKGVDELVKALELNQTQIDVRLYDNPRGTFTDMQIELRKHPEQPYQPVPAIGHKDCRLPGPDEITKTLEQI